MLRRHAAGLLAVFLLLLLVATNPSLKAQETYGDLTGVITDATGGVIVGAQISVVNAETQQALTVSSGSNGTYWARHLSPGRYVLKASMAGFRTKEASDILVLVGKTAQLSFAMEVGSVEQTVQVTEKSALIDTTSTIVAHNITAEEFDRLPKPRNFQALAVLSPSVNTGKIEAGFQVNGASSAENNYYIDGVSTNSLVNGSARQGAVFEFLQEVQVKTNGIEAEYGGALGGVVSAITKSGGNQWHGEGHYYFFGNRISAGSVQRLQLNPETEDNPIDIQDVKNKKDSNEFGGSIGGPLVRNRVFLFASASPQWMRAKYHYLFDNGKTPGDLNRQFHKDQMFGKLDVNATDWMRMHFSWLYSPEYQTGALYSYDGYAPNVSVRSLESALGGTTRGYRQPEQSYSGQIDVLASPTSLFTVKGGRYFLNYKEVGIPFLKYYWWQTSSVGLDLPAALQQPLGYATTSGAQIQYDKTTRTYINADFSHFASFLGQHNLKAGTGVQKNVNNVFDSWNGPLGRVELYWDKELALGRGTYGYYTVTDGATRGSAGATITHMYFQDQWRVLPRLTLNYGLRLEKETIPSFRRNVQEYAIQFGFGDKIAPRVGASWDVLGDGRLKISGAWGRFFDWTKYDLARGTFGGDTYNVYYRALDTLDIYSLDLTNMPGKNLWTSPYRDRRLPGFSRLDPNVKPMSSYQANVGVEYELAPQTVLSVRYNKNHLIRTIEDMGALDAEGNEVYRYGNPGEGANTIAPVTGLTCVIKVGEEGCGFQMPRAKRDYDAMEVSVTRRFGSGWFANASYVYSRLYGNYSGLQNTDEYRPSTLGYGFSWSQVSGADGARPGGNANRSFDLDEAMWDSHGNAGLMGRLPTDRPHVFKLNGSKEFNKGFLKGFDFGGFFRVMSGTPVTTQVVTFNDIPFYVNGRGDYGRTPILSQTDLVVGREFLFGEVKKLRLEFNMLNLFNQKTDVFTFDRVNREEHAETAGIVLSGTDLSKGFNWQELLAATPDGTAAASDPRFGMASDFNTGFQGRFLIKFTF